MPRRLRIALFSLGVLVAVAAGWLGARRFLAWRAGIAHAYAGHNTAATILNGCGPTRAAEKADCYARALSATLGRDGIANAAATLTAITGVDPEAEQIAHVLAHGLGIEAYNRDHDIGTLFAGCGDGFSSGCRHGVLQAYFQSQHTVGESEIRALCQPFQRVLGSNYLKFQCVHGMGHGLTMFYAYDVPRALAGCDYLERDWDRQSCYGGVFMENIVNATTPEHPASRLAAHHHGQGGGTPAFRALDPADPLYPCSAMARRYLYACYMMQTSAILYWNHGDIAAAGRTCAAAPAPWPATCFVSLGRDITSYAHHDLQETVRLCRLGAAGFLRQCYDGAVKALVDWTAQPAVGFAFCAALADDAETPACYQALGTEIAAMTARPFRARQCAAAPSAAAVAACRKGAGLSAD